MNNNNIIPITPTKRDRKAQTVLALVTRLHDLDVRIAELVNAQPTLRYLKRQRQELQHQLDLLIEHRKGAEET